jgi:hypothetical protein
MVREFIPTHVCNGKKLALNYLCIKIVVLFVSGPTEREDVTTGGVSSGDTFSFFPEPEAPVATPGGEAAEEEPVATPGGEAAEEAKPSVSVAERAALSEASSSGDTEPKAPVATPDYSQYKGMTMGGITATDDDNAVKPSADVKPSAADAGLKPSAADAGLKPSAADVVAVAEHDKTHPAWGSEVEMTFRRELKLGATADVRISIHGSNKAEFDGLLDFGAKVTHRIKRAAKHSLLVMGNESDASPAPSFPGRDGLGVSGMYKMFRGVREVHSDKVVVQGQVIKMFCMTEPRTSD